MVCVYCCFVRLGWSCGCFHCGGFFRSVCWCLWRVVVIVACVFAGGCGFRLVVLLSCCGLLCVCIVLSCWVFVVSVLLCSLWCCALVLFWVLVLLHCVYYGVIVVLLRAFVVSVVWGSWCCVGVVVFLCVLAFCGFIMLLSLLCVIDGVLVFPHCCVVVMLLWGFVVLPWLLFQLYYIVVVCSCGGIGVLVLLRVIVLLRLCGFSMLFFRLWFCYVWCCGFVVGPCVLMCLS